MAPEYMHVVSTRRWIRIRAHTGFLTYAAYYRYVKRRLEDAIENNGSVTETYPVPIPHCSILPMVGRV